MTDDNPFASPDPGRLPVSPGPPSGPPSYEQQWQSPYDRPKRRGIPRSLVAACHTSAVGAWMFVVTVGMFYALVNGGPSGTFFALLLILVLGGVFATMLALGILLAFVGLVTAIPLYAIWRAERDTDESSDSPERVAIFHLAVAWAFLVYVLIRLFV